jgi:hypothetical protein
VTSITEIKAFRDELSKIAARKGLKMIRQLVSSGSPKDIAQANRLAQRPGVLKPSAAGSQVKDLGMGSEGLATLTADPKRGLAVRKLYNPQGIATPELIRRKHQAGKVLGHERSIAQYYGQSPTPRGRGTMQFNEYVPSTGSAVSSRAAEATRQQASQAIQQSTPFNNPADIRAGNMVIDSRTRKPRVIDYLPTKSTEVSFAGGSNRISVTPEGHRAGILNPSMAHTQTPGRLKNQFLGRGSVKPQTSVRQPQILGEATKPITARAIGPMQSSQATKLLG